MKTTTPETAALFAQWATLIRALDEAQAAASDLSALLDDSDLPEGPLDPRCDITAADLRHDAGCIDWQVRLLADIVASDAPPEVTDAARLVIDLSDAPTEEDHLALMERYAAADCYAHVSEQDCPF